MEINSQAKALTLEPSLAKGTPAANNKDKEVVQEVTSTVRAVEDKKLSRAEPIENLESAVSSINDYVQNLQRSLQFTVDEVSGKNVVTVLDKETDEVIRQFPSEEVLEIARNLSEDKEKAISLFNSQA
jgi:flagellar protein FlaG